MASSSLTLWFCLGAGFSPGFSLCGFVMLPQFAKTIALDLYNFPASVSAVDIASAIFQLVDLLRSKLMRFSSSGN